MIKHIITFILMLLSGMIIAQQKTDEEAVRAVADNILKQPVTQFIGVSDGSVYNSTSEIPEGEDVRFKSPLTEWHYSNGVLDMAMIKLGEYLNEDKYLEYAKKHVAFGFANYDYFKDRFRGDRNHWHWPFGQLWNFKELDDCGAMGAAIVEVNKIDPRPEYLTYMQNTANHILNGQVRLEDGTLSRTFPKDMTVWADDAYMATSFLTRMGKFSGDSQYFDEAAKQLIQMDAYLWDSAKELYYHCYYDNENRNGVAYWGRANGWIMISLVDLIEVMPEEHPKREELMSILKRQIIGASRWQNGNGMWNQLLDKNDSYDESSVTAMYVYGVAKAINNGWIDMAYRNIARSGWRALKNNEITEDGRFTNVCVGTGISEDLPFYFNRPVGDNEKHGLGLIINTAIEIMKLESEK